MNQLRSDTNTKERKRAFWMATAAAGAGIGALLAVRLDAIVPVWAFSGAIIGAAVSFVGLIWRELRSVHPPTPD